MIAILLILWIIISVPLILWVAYVDYIERHPEWYIERLLPREAKKYFETNKKKRR